MKVLVIGDMHIKRNSERILNIFISKIQGLVQQSKPDLIVFLGDLLDSFNIVHVQTWNLLHYLLSEVNSLGVNTVLIPGNHDMLNNRVYLTNDHFLANIKGFQYIKPISTVSTITTGAGKLVFVPYVPNGRFKEALGSHIDAKVIFAHQEFLGAQMGAITSKNGDDWAGSYPIVISGHVHQRQRIGNVWYIGTPYQHSFGENDTNGVSIIVIDQGVSETFIDLKMPKKITLTMTAEQLLEWQPEGELDLLKVKIVDTKQNIQRITKTDRFKELAQLLRIVTKTVDDVTAVRKNPDNYGYMQWVQKMISQQSSREHLMELFDKIVKGEEI